MIVMVGRDKELRLVTLEEEVLSYVVIEGYKGKRKKEIAIERNADGLEVIHE